MLAIGLALFLIGAFFFEGLIGLSGFGLNLGWSISYWPLLLIGAGIILLIRSFFEGERA
jgi:hypothetical protein